MIRMGIFVLHDSEFYVQGIPLTPSPSPHEYMGRGEPGMLCASQFNLHALDYIDTLDFSS